jgi:hypothetical protein
MDNREADRHAPHAATQSSSPAPPARHPTSWLGRPVAEPNVQLALIAWPAANLEGHLR